MSLTSQVQRSVQWTRLPVRLPLHTPAVQGTGHRADKDIVFTSAAVLCGPGERPSIHPQLSVIQRWCGAKVHGSGNSPVLSHTHEIQVFIIAIAESPMSVKSQRTRINGGVIKNPALNHVGSQAESDVCDTLQADEKETSSNLEMNYLTV